jgi:ABC-2 type transport system ATP-binding protein
VPAAAIARLSRVTKVYPGAERPAVEDLTLTLQPGEILSLLGSNGAGKTTTIKMLAGLVLPSDGRVRVMGHDMVRERTEGVRHIGAVLEGARNLYWRLSARDNLLYFGRLRLVPRRILKDRIDTLLELLGLSDCQQQEVRTFSRGMQQKLAIAAALLHDPALLLLDEPTLGLDVAAARQLEATILRLAHEQGKAILLTTHTMSLAEKLSDRILVIDRGREIACGPTGKLLKDFNRYGDTLQVRVEGLLSREFRRSLRGQFTGVQVAPDTDHTLLSWPAPTQTNLIHLLQFLDGEGVRITDVSRRRPTLEDVFLQLTGEGRAR